MRSVIGGLVACVSCLAGCGGTHDPWAEMDRDGDGHTPLEGDCDDEDPGIHPGARELPCDGIDQDCDGEDEQEYRMVAIMPEPGSGEVHPLSSGLVEVKGQPGSLDPRWEDLALVFLDPSGQALEGEQSRGGPDPWARFSPDQPMGIAQPYQLQLTVGQCAPQQWPFSTGNAGAMVDPAPTVGGDFYLDHGSGWMSQPWELAPYMMQVAVDVHVGLHVESVDEEAEVLEAFYAPLLVDGDGFRQNLCLPTGRWGGGPTDGPGAAWNNPYLEAGPFDFHFVYRPDANTVEGVAQGTVTGATLRNDGQAIVGLYLDELLDTRFYDEFWGIELCAVLGDPGTTCVDCPDGSGTFCLPTTFEDIEAPRVDVGGVHPDTGEPLDRLIEVTPAQAVVWAAGNAC